MFPEGYKKVWRLFRVAEETLGIQVLCYLALNVYKSVWLFQREFYVVTADGSWWQLLISLVCFHPLQLWVSLNCLTRCKLWTVPVKPQQFLWKLHCVSDLHLMSWTSATVSLTIQMRRIIHKIQRRDFCM